MALPGTALGPGSQLHPADLVAVAAYIVVCVGLSLWLGLRSRRRSVASGDSYALADRRLPWWVIGIADVATGDGADAFWIHVFFIGGFIGFHRFYWVAAIVSLPLGVFWARYWRRLALESPGHLFEVRYGGPVARGFRVFSAIYGVLCGQAILIGYVLRGFAQSLAPLLGWSTSQLMVIFGGLTLGYTLLSGLLTVAYMDVLQFALIMAGRVALALLLLSAAGGLGPVLDRAIASRGIEFLSPFPPSAAADAGRFGEFALDPLSLLALAMVGLWSAANHALPSVQKSLAARDERHAAVGQLLNTVLSLGVRTLPLILIGLCAVALLPAGRHDTEQWADLVRKHAPPGLYGFLLIGIIAGYTSTLAGLLNFSASILLTDVYRRVVRPSAGSSEQVAAGRALTLLVAVAGNLWAWLLLRQIDGAWINFMNSVVALFVLPVGLLRWVWWRLSIYAEMVGFVAAFPLAYAVWFGAWGLPALKDRPYWQSFAVLFGLGLVVLVVVTLLTPAARGDVLERFYQRVNPPGFWGPVAAAARGPGWDDPATRRQRRRAQWGEVLTGLYGSGFAATLILGMCSLLVRRFTVGGLLLATSALLGTRVLRRAIRAAPLGRESPDELPPGGGR